jgi:hypothetical protein
MLDSISPNDRAAYPNNLLDRVSALEAQTRLLASRRVVSDTLADISTDLGVVVAGMFICPAAASTEPTDVDFTGCFMAAVPQDFGALGLYNIGGVNAGVLEFGINAVDGKAYAGGGSVILDATGITLADGTVLNGAVHITQSGDIAFQEGITNGVTGRLEIGVEDNPAASAPQAYIRFQVPSTSSNLLLTNPDFELGNTSGWNIGASDTFVIDTTLPHSGTYDGHAYKAGGGSGTLLTATANRAIVTAGTTYTFAIWFRAVTNSMSNIAIIAYFYDNGGVTKGQFTLYNGSSNPAWAFYSRNVTAPVGATLAGITISYSGTHWVNIFLDDASIVLAPAASSIILDTTGKVALGFTDGWTTAPDSWAYASSTALTVPTGAASRYQVGNKIKLTQTTVKYFYIVAVADTLLTITGGSDYTIANAPITNAYISNSESPVGFPAAFNYTPIGIAASNVTLAGRFFMVGNRVFFDFTASFSGAITFISMPTLPVSMSASYLSKGDHNISPIGIGGYRDFSASAHLPSGLVPTVNASGSQNLFTITDTSGTSLSASNPITWAASDSFEIHGNYEA